MFPGLANGLQNLLGGAFLAIVATSRVAVMLWAKPTVSPV